jgi:hypothetical protein
MHCLSSVYSVTIPVHVLGLLVAHCQEVRVYICDSWYVLYVLVDCRCACPTYTNCCMYTLLRPDDGLLASLKHVEV